MASIGYPRASLRPCVGTRLIRSLTVPSLTLRNLTTILASILTKRPSTFTLALARTALRAMPDSFRVRRRFRGLTSERVRSFCCDRQLIRSSCNGCIRIVWWWYWNVGQPVRVLITPCAVSHLGRLRYHWHRQTRNFAIMCGWYWRGLLVRRVGRMGRVRGVRSSRSGVFLVRPTRGVFRLDDL